MINADAMFDGAAELGRAIAAKRAADRQAARDARNARRRARYAATPRTPKTTSSAPSHPDDTAWEQSCYCGSTPAPPCWYCESGGAEEQP